MRALFPIASAPVALAALALACAGDIDLPAPAPAPAPSAAPAPLVQRELAALAAITPGPPPSPGEIDALVANGFPKPASPDPAVRARARHAHETLMGWGHDLLHLALQAATSDDPQRTRARALALRAHLERWTSHGTWFGDLADVANTGNLPLEMTWFLGNAARAAGVLEALSDEPGSGATGVWPAAERAAFRAWADAVAARYVAFPVFPAGLSNRKASQIETLMRLAELDPDPTRRRARLGALLAELDKLLVAAIRDDGFIAEDSCRDKYHDQFFLASALQARELAERHDLHLAPHGAALRRLVAAVGAAARRNQDAARPPECPTMADPKPNHRIPFWALAPRLYADAGLAAPPEVGAMLDAQYGAAGDFELVMQWGYDAIAVAFELTGDVRGARLRGVIEAERFDAATDADDWFQGDPACRSARHLATDVVALAGAGHGCALDHIVPGETWDYRVTFTRSGHHRVSVLVAAPAGATLDVAIVAGTGKEYPKGTVVAPPTAGADVFRWSTVTIHEPATGALTLRLRARSAGARIDALRVED